MASNDGEIYLATVDIIENKVKLIFSLKRVVETDQEWMIEIFEQNITLAHYMVLFVSFQDHLFVEHFHRIDGVFLLVFRGVNLSEAALSNGAKKFKITRLYMILLRGAQIDHLVTVVRGDRKTVIMIVIIFDAVLHQPIKQ